MTSGSFLYSVHADGVDKAAEIASAALGIKFTPGDSWDRGGDYFWHRVPGVFDIEIQGNWECEGGLAEIDFPDAGILLYYSGIVKNAPVKDKIDANKNIFTLLRARYYSEINKRYQPEPDPEGA